MNRLLSIFAALALLVIAALPAPAVAVDASISPLCRPGAPEVYSRPGGFCEQVASNGSMATSTSGPGCPAGFERNPAPPPKCVPVAD